MMRLARWAASPLLPLIPAAGLAAFYLVCHLAGWREYTSVLSGAAPTGQLMGWMLAGLGLLYVLAYLGAVLLAPVLAAAAIAGFVVERAAARLKQPR